MCPFKKKQTTYTRPTGLRAKKTWQVATSAIRHPIPVYLMLGTVCAILFMLSVLTVLSWNFFSEENRVLMFFAVFAKLPLKVPLFVSTIAFVALAIPLVYLLSCMAFHAIPTYRRVGSQVCTATFILFSLICFFIALTYAWPFAICCMGMFMLVNSLAVVTMLRFSGLLYGLYFLAAFVIIGTFTENTEAIAAYYSTFTIALLTGTIALLAIGVAIWCWTMRYLQTDWLPSGDFVAAMQATTKPSLRRPVNQHGKEFWLARWFYREMDQRCQKFAGRVTWERAERSRLFALVNRPPRLVLISIGLAFVIAVLIVYFAYVERSLDLGAVLFVGIYFMSMASLGIGMALAVQWKRSLSYESLFPMRRTDYVRAMVVSHVRILTAVILPFIAIVIPVLLFSAPMMWTSQNLSFMVLYFIAWLSISLGLSTIGVTFSWLATIPIYPVAIFVLVWRMSLENHTIFVWDFIAVIALGFTLAAIGIWRLHRIEPDRVKL